MKTQCQIMDEAWDHLETIYTKVLGDMWVNTVQPVIDFRFRRDGSEVIESTDGFVEMEVEMVKPFGRNAWKYHVTQNLGDDVGEQFETFSPSIAAAKFLEIHVHMRISCANV